MDQEPRAYIPDTNQLVVWRFNTWNFYEISNLSLRETSSGKGKYTIMNEAFGLVSSNETDPKMVRVIGAAGDYLFMDREGNLTVVSQSLAKYYV